MSPATDSVEPASADSSSVSSTLLSQLRSGRPDAWKRFVRLYSPIVYRWCRQSGLVAAAAADVLQEVLLAVMLHLADFARRSDRDSFTAWLATITRNKVCDHYRQRRGRPQGRGGTTAQHQLDQLPQPPPPSAEQIRPDAQSATWLSQSALEMIRAEFEPRTWTAFQRTALDRQSPAHVAADLQMSVPAVYMAKSRVLRRLREVIGELPE